MDMASATRRQFLQRVGRAAGGLALSGLAPQGACAPAAGRIGRLVIQAPASPPSIALAKLVADGAFDRLVERAEFLLWKTPDEMRARITSGQAHISGLPVNVAAGLYNRGLPVTLMDVYIWGILYVVGTHPAARRWEDLRGQEIIIPFQGDLPDLVAQLLMEYHGLEPAADVSLRYVPSPTEAAGLLAAGQAHVAVLSEPSATLAIVKAQEAGVTLHRLIDMQQDWAACTGQPARLPMAGIAVLPGLVQAQPAIAARLQDAGSDAVAWVNTHAQQAAALGVAYIPGVPAAIMAASLPHIALEHVSARDARPEIEFFFSQLAHLSPALYGGRLPPDDFYYGT